jgi:imidazolonepropionase-like amidohydrolase
MAQDDNSSPANVLLINGRLIDGVAGEPVDSSFVHVRDGRIAAVGRMANAPRDPEARLYDLGGRTVMPGLIDCHVHFVYNGFRNLEEVDRCPVESAAINATLNAKKVLEAGYTAVRDVGTIGNVAVAVRDAIKAGKIVGPKMVASGQVISATAGPGDILPPHWTSTGGLGMLADGIDAIRKAVRTQIKRGVDNIKLMASGVEVGNYAYTWMTTMSAAEIEAATEEAHRWGRSVAVHAQSYDSVKFSLRAGVDTVEHGTRLDEESIELFKKTGIILVPTLCTLFSVLQLGEKLNLNPKQREEMAVNEPLWLESTRMAYEAGIPIAAGGDLGNRFPHGTNARELEFLVNAGLPPMKALQAATSVAARAIKRDALFGAVKPGLAADILVVDGDPLADIKILQDKKRLALVLLDGRPVAGTLRD